MVIPAESRMLIDITVSRRVPHFRRLSQYGKAFLSTPTSMSLQTNEQTVHDRINLGRLVKRPENSVTNEDWSLQHNQHNAWIKTQGTLQA
jgi:hypothetical protein